MRSDRVGLVSRSMNDSSNFDSSPSGSGEPSRMSPGGALAGLLTRMAPAASYTAVTVARYGETSRLQRLLDNKPQLLTTPAAVWGETPLTAAADAGRNDAVMELLRLASAKAPGTVRAMLSHHDAYGHTALICAIAKGHADVVQELLRHPEIDINLPNTEGQTPLHVAALHAPQLLSTLLEHSSIDPAKVDANGDTPLFFAAKHNLDEAAVTIAGHPKAMSDSPNKGGLTPLLVAIAAGNHDTVTALVDSGAVDPERFHSGISRPLNRLLLTPSPDSAAWRRAVLAFATSPKTFINAPDEMGNTLLHVAAELDLPDVVAGIMSRLDAAPHEANSSGQTALDIARHMGHDEIVYILLENEHPNHRRSDGNTAMYSAIWANDLDTVVALLGTDKFDPNFPCDGIQSHSNVWTGDTPLNLASTLRRDEIVKLLLSSSRVNRDIGNHQADGTVTNEAYKNNYNLGRYIAALEQDDRFKFGTVPDECNKDASFHLTLALEQSLELRRRGDVPEIPEIAKALLREPAREPLTFNVNGVEYSRNMIEQLATHHPDRRFVMGSSDVEAAMGRDDDENATAQVWKNRANQLYADIVARTPHDALLADEAALYGIRRAIDRSSLMPWKKKKRLARRGLEDALKKNSGIHISDVGTDTRRALTAIWGYIESRPSKDLRTNLTKSLLGRLAEIGKEEPCPIGCLQRILYTPEGIDHSLAPVRSDSEAIRNEIASIAGKVNNRYEFLYGDCALDLESLDKANDDSSFSVGKLTECEKALVGRYQAGMTIDENTVIELKQAMVKEAVIADLVQMQGWNPQDVERELGPVLESMRYL